MPLHLEQKTAIEFDDRRDDGYATCLAATPHMFALDRVLVVVFGMVLVHVLRTEPLSACPCSGCPMGEQTGAPPTHHAALKWQCR